MTFEDHCAESVRLFGAPFEDVHRWLDELSGRPGIGSRHRRYRHHRAGLEQVRQLFGEAAVPAAEQHIISDLMEEGWKPGDRFPEDEADYVRMGLW